MADRPDKRDAILDAALELFCAYGFHGTAVPQVAERAKVGAGTIYRYFPSKEALVNEVYRTWKGRLAEAILSEFPDDAPARDQFHHFWSRAWLFGLEHPHALAFLELHHHASYLDPKSREIEQQVLAPAMVFLADCAAKRITKPMDAWLLASFVWGALMGVVKAGWEGRLEFSEKTLDDAEQCCWEAIRR